jgi:hypothetical protein
MTNVNITIFDLENNFEQMRRAWDPQQPVESLFKQIQDCADYSEAGGVIIGHPQQINVYYPRIFATRHFMSACHRWNENPNIEKAWSQFKAQFAAAHRQHISTRKCKVNLQQPQDTMEQTPMWVIQSTKWWRPPLARWPT